MFTDTSCCCITTTNHCHKKGSSFNNRYHGKGRYTWIKCKQKGTLRFCLLFTIQCSEAIGEVATFQWFRKQTTKCYCERSSWNECSMLKCNRKFHLHGKGLFYLPPLFILLFHLLLLFTSFPHWIHWCYIRVLSQDSTLILALLTKVYQ